MFVLVDSLTGSKCMCEYSGLHLPFITVFTSCCLSCVVQRHRHRPLWLCCLCGLTVIPPIHSTQIREGESKCWSPRAWDEIMMSLCLLPHSHVPQYCKYPKNVELRSISDLYDLHGYLAWFGLCLMSKKKRLKAKRFFLSVSSGLSVKNLEWCLKTWDFHFHVSQKGTLISRELFHQDFHWKSNLVSRETHLPLLRLQSGAQEAVVQNSWLLMSFAKWKLAEILKQLYFLFTHDIFFCFFHGEHKQQQLGFNKSTIIHCSFWRLHTLIQKSFSSQTLRVM